MGLDTYSSNNKLNYVGLNLCGGMLSATGQGSFRGKVYNDFIEDITGESLYQEEISETIVKEMANKLVKFAQLVTLSKIKRWDITIEEVQDLARWFQVTAEGNAKVYGWW